MNVTRPAKAAARASILVGLLWCMALLAVVVIGVLHSSRLELTLVKNYGDRIQAHYLALAGVEKAKALLFTEAIERRRASKNHSGQLFDAPDLFKSVRFSRGEYSIIHRSLQDGSDQLLYGITDEESRLNLNQAAPEELAKFVGFTPDIIAAITDWRDEDNQVSPMGAEAEYYASLRPPYLPRNGQFQTVRELLMVRGISKEFLMGDDIEQNGFLDKQAGSRSLATRSRSNGGPDAGFYDFLTVDGFVENKDAGGEKRVNVQTRRSECLERRQRHNR